VCCENGEGVDKDVTQALTWYCKAAEQGDSDAQNYLECLFTEGLSTEQDKADTFLWYQNQAEKNLKFAQKALVKAYSLGIGVSQDIKLATYWVLRSGLEYETSIRIAEENFDVIKFIPEALTTFSEFSKIYKIEFQKGYLSKENFISISDLIRLNKSIGLLIFTEITYENFDALKIIEALKVNSTVTDFIFDSTNISKSLHIEIQKLLDQNNAIDKAREYVKNHPIIVKYELPIDSIARSLDDLIITSLKGDQSLDATKLAIDEFLIKSIQASKEKNSG